MKNKGQVFTTDMIFALILVASLLSISTQAYVTVSGRMKSYSTRYSLERIANDTADVLVKTSGDPIDWETHPSDLNTLGLAKLNPNNRPISNYIDSDKISKLAGEISGNNWNPNTDNTDNEIMEFFGMNNSVENFEIKTIKNGETIWNVWPGKENEEDSPAENATEVVTVNRIVYGSLAHVAGESPPVQHDVTVPATEPDNVFFWIYPGELETYNWYLYVENKENLSPGVPVMITINRNAAPGTSDYKFKLGGGGAYQDIPSWAPEENEHEGIEDDPDVENNLVKNELNYVNIYVQGQPEKYVKVYVVAIPEATAPDVIPEMIEKEPYILQVKIWR